GAADARAGLDARARGHAGDRRGRVGRLRVRMAGRPGNGARPPVSAWTFTPMTQVEAEVIAGWHYPGEYAFYDADWIPEGLGELLEPAQRGDQYHSAWNAEGELEGFAQLSPLEGGATEIGLGLRPDLT